MIHLISLKCAFHYSWESYRKNFKTLLMTCSIIRNYIMYPDNPDSLYLFKYPFWTGKLKIKPCPFPFLPNPRPPPKKNNAINAQGPLSISSTNWRLGFEIFVRRILLFDAYFSYLPPGAHACKATLSNYPSLSSASGTRGPGGGYPPAIRRISVTSRMGFVKFYWNHHGGLISNNKK